MINELPANVYRRLVSGTIVVITGMKPSSTSAVHLCGLCTVGVVSYTSAYLFDTLSTGLPGTVYHPGQCCSPCCNASWDPDPPNETPTVTTTSMTMMVIEVAKKFCEWLALVASLDKGRLCPHP